MNEVVEKFLNLHHLWFNGWEAVFGLPNALDGRREDARAALTEFIQTETTNPNWDRPMRYVVQKFLEEEWLP